MVKRVTLTRPKRDYSGSGYSRPGAPDAKGSSSVEKNKEEKGGVNYPLKRGVIINPPSGLAEKREAEQVGVEALLALADQLKPADKKMLLARLALSQQAAKPEERELGMWALGVQTALAHTTGAADGAAHGPMVLKRYLAPAQNWVPVAEFMEQAGFSKLEVTKRQAVYMMLAELLVKHAGKTARAVHAPLTPKFVADRAPHLAAIFDTAFPGYAAAGLAHVVAARLTGPRP